MLKDPVVNGRIPEVFGRRKSPVKRRFSGQNTVGKWYSNSG
jgi:hypothetical protein